MNSTQSKIEINLGLYESLPDFFLINSPLSYLFLMAVVVMLGVLVAVAYFSLKNSSHLMTKVEVDGADSLSTKTNSSWISGLKVMLRVFLSPLTVLVVLMPPALALKSINDSQPVAQAFLSLPSCVIEDALNRVESTAAPSSHLKFNVHTLGGEVKNSSSKIWLEPHSLKVLEKAYNPESPALLEFSYSKGVLGLWSLKKIKHINFNQCLADSDCDLAQFHVISQFKCKS